MLEAADIMPEVERYSVVHKHGRTGEDYRHDNDP